ncbi:MAG: hypothetical protein GX590_10920 [Lentisphaerae bacterium]|nr:hypothetical protein [Lentisphaerota bacterium]
MFGIEDGWVLGAYVLSFAGMVACVVYGIVHWNRDDEPAKLEDVQWAREEKEAIEKTL